VTTCHPASAIVQDRLSGVDLASSNLTCQLGSSFPVGNSSAIGRSANRLRAFTSEGVTRRTRSPNRHGRLPTLGFAHQPLVQTGASLRHLSLGLRLPGHSLRSSLSTPVPDHTCRENHAGDQHARPGKYQLDRILVAQSNDVCRLTQERPSPDIAKREPIIICPSPRRLVKALPSTVRTEAADALVAKSAIKEVGTSLREVLAHVPVGCGAGQFKPPSVADLNQRSQVGRRRRFGGRSTRTAYRGVAAEHAVCETNDGSASLARRTARAATDSDRLTAPAPPPRSTPFEHRPRTDDTPVRLAMPELRGNRVTISGRQELRLIPARPSRREGLFHALTCSDVSEHRRQG